MGRIVALSLCLMLMGAGAPRAETAFDLVFRTGTLDGLPQGTELRYDDAATLEAGPGQVVVDIGADGQAHVERRASEGQEPTRVLGQFRARVGNPVGMVFMERTVQAVAEATGGSPFYIRNRIRDALAGPGAVEALTIDWDGEAVPATAIALRPFANDARRAELGGFADLEIRVVVSEAVPGWYHSIDAEAPGSGAGEPYSASLSLVGVEE